MCCVWMGMWYYVLSCIHYILLQILHSCMLDLYYISGLWTYIRNWFCILLISVWLCFSTLFCLHHVTGAAGNTHPSSVVFTIVYIALLYTYRLGRHTIVYQADLSSCSVTYYGLSFYSLLPITWCLLASCPVNYDCLWSDHCTFWCNCYYCLALHSNR